MANKKYLVDMPYKVKCTKCSKNKIIKCQQKCTRVRLEKSTVMCPCQRLTKQDDRRCECLEGKMRQSLCGKTCGQKPKADGGDVKQQQAALIAPPRCDDVSSKDWCDGDPYCTTEELKKAICIKWKRIEREKNSTRDAKTCLPRMYKEFRELYKKAKISQADKVDATEVEKQFMSCMEQLMRIEVQQIEVSRRAQVSFVGRIVRWLCPCMGFCA